MSEPLERWGAAAPEPFCEAASMYDRDGPSELQVARMVERIELGAGAVDGARSAPAPRSSKLIWRLGVGALTVTLFGAALVLLSRRGMVEQPSPPVLAPRAATRAAELSEPRSAPPQEVDRALPPPALPAREAPRASRSVQLRRRSTVPADPTAELALLLRARRVLAADPSRAYRLTEQHRESYRRGALSEERELLAVEALVLLGKRAEADARAAQFARSFPGSLHARRLTLILQRSAP